MFLVDQRYDWTGGIRVSTEEKGFRNHRFAAKIQFKLYNKKINSKDKVRVLTSFDSVSAYTDST